MIVADSDVLIDSLRGKQPVARRIAIELKTGDLMTTAISAFELLSGAKDGGERAKVETLLAAVGIVPLDNAAAKRAAQIRRQLEAKGQAISMADYLIAGICIEHAAVLLTRNTEHFARVDGLKLGHLSVE